MIFRGTRKLMRDRKLGLVFRWSGAYAANRGGMTLAFLGTVGLFALMFFGLQLEVNSSKALSSHQPKLVLYDGSDERLNHWIELNSPRLPNWDREVGRDRVYGEFTLASDKLNAQSLDWRDVDFKKKKLQQTPRALAGIRELPPVRRHALPEVETESEPTKWKLEISIAGALSERLEAGQEFQNNIPLEWQGRATAFIIAVAEDGSVKNCAPLKRNEEKSIIAFENWVRTLKFKPSEKAYEQGVIRLRVVERDSDD